MFDLRGYVLFLVVGLALCVRGAGVAILDVCMIFTIIAVSKDGPKLFGHLGRKLNEIQFLQTPTGAAILMALPVKTLTALLGAKDSHQLEAISLNATLALMVLGLVLGIWPTIEEKLRFSSWKTTQRIMKGQGTLVTVVDLLILGLLMALGKDGEAIFGNLALWLQTNLPIVCEPWVRGLLAIIPIKTASTLYLAGSSKKRSAIASKGSSAMVVLSVLTFSIFLTSDITKPFSLAIGVGCCLLAIIGTKNFAKECKIAV